MDSPAVSGFKPEFHDLEPNTYLEWAFTPIPADLNELMRSKTLSWFSLSPRELDLFYRLKTKKRQNEWLAGRIAAKKVVLQWVNHSAFTFFIDCPRTDSLLQDCLHSFEIINSPSGRPQAQLNPDKRSNFNSILSLFFNDLSISHSNEWACAALLSCQKKPSLKQSNTRDERKHRWLQPKIGIDLEKIKLPLDSDLISIALTEHEKAQIRTDPSLFYAIWTAKEALLKALDLGLSVDLLELEVKLSLNQKTTAFYPSFLGQIRWRDRLFTTQIYRILDFYVSICKNS
ncbi:MAG: 4'-phosphopantetheinyl transferase family protein [Bdellovibrionia bacterium]